MIDIADECLGMSQWMWTTNDELMRNIAMKRARDEILKLRREKQYLLDICARLNIGICPHLHLYADEICPVCSH